MQGEAIRYEGYSTHVPHPPQCPSQSKPHSSLSSSRQSRVGICLQLPIFRRRSTHIWQHVRSHLAACAAVQLFPGRTED
jgi:hypothetical protein